MKKRSKALIPILVALIAMAAVGHASSTEEERNCGFNIDIVDGSPSSAEVAVDSNVPQNLTLIWRYTENRPVQSYFRSETSFETNFTLIEDRKLESIEAHSLDCQNVSDMYP